MDNLCQVCRRAIGHLILPNNHFYNRRHQKDIFELQQSAAEHCIICTVLWNEIASRRQPQGASNVSSIKESTRDPLSRLSVWPGHRSSSTLFFNISSSKGEPEKDNTIYRHFVLQRLKGTSCRIFQIQARFNFIF